MATDTASARVAKPPSMSVRALVITWWVLILGTTAIFIAMAGGHPRSNWIYPLVLGLLAWGTIRMLRRGDRPLGVGDDPAKPVLIALAGSIAAFAIAFAAIYVYWTLIWTERLSLGATIGASGMVAVNHYRQKRGYDYAAWPTFVVYGLVLIGTIALRSLGIIGPYRN